MDAVTEERRAPAPWLFAVGAMPYGVFNGVIALALPYLLRRHGVSVAQIASTLAAAQLPAMWYFLWAPLIDMRFRRRTWVMMLSVASAVCATTALWLDLATRIGLVTALLVVGSALNQPISSALGGLAAIVVPEPLRSRTAGLGQGGMLAGGALAGGLAVWLGQHWSDRFVALVIGVLVAVPAFALLAVDEPRRAPSSARHRASEAWREVMSTLKRRDVWLAFLLFLSPAGAGALILLLPAVAVDYHASPGIVIWVVAVGGGLCAAGGAVVGGFVCERIDRWLVYPGVGVVVALIAGLAAIAPRTVGVYVAAAASYGFITGLSYAAFMALTLDLLGSAAAAAGTRFTLFVAATNVPLVYTVWLDGLAHDRFGLRGMLWADAAANGIAGVLLLIVMWRRRRVTFSHL